MHEIAVLLEYLTELGVDGFMMSPAYGYAAVQETNPLGAQDIFMTRDDIHAKFREAKKLLAGYRLNTSPVYLEFLRGERDLKCAAWANPTRNLQRLEGPLLSDHRHAPRNVSRSDRQRPIGTSWAAATIRAARTAWCTAASSRPPCWASTAGWATR